jgi:hypothetical protein
MRDLECLWNANSELFRNEADREKALQEIVQELKFPEPTLEDVKLEVKTSRTKQVAELAKASKPEKSGTGLHDVLKLFSNKHIPFRMAFVFHEPQTLVWYHGVFVTPVLFDSHFFRNCHEH